MSEVPLYTPTSPRVANISLVASRLIRSYCSRYMGPYDLLGVEYDPLTTKEIVSERRTKARTGPPLGERTFRTFRLDAIPPQPDPWRFRRTSFYQTEPSRGWFTGIRSLMKTRSPMAPVRCSRLDHSEWSMRGPVWHYGAEADKLTTEFR